MKSCGRGRGSTDGAGKGSGRGRGGGRGGGRGFFFFMDKPPPPHKGEKEVPQGAPDALSGLTFVISGVLDSLEREEAEDLIKRHGGRVTSAVSGKTNYLLADEDVGGRKSQKAKELGTPLLTEDGLFELIRASVKNKPSGSVASESKKSTKVFSENKVTQPKPETKSIAPTYAKEKHSKHSAEKVDGNVPFTDKYAPKSTDEIIGNTYLVSQLKDWLKNWEENSLALGNNTKKGSGYTTSSAKKAVLLSGPPGIGKTTTAKLVCQELNFPVLEVNASDSRGKSDSKVLSGLAGKTSNVVKEMINNESIELLSTKNEIDSKWNLRKNPVLIMDEVDGMSAGDRGGVSELISCIKSTRIPIICICNDKYARKLMSLLSHVLQLNFRKPTKQQMAKRLNFIVERENIHIPEGALEELAELSNGDMRMALNHLQFLSVSSKNVSFDDVKRRLSANMKDEDVRPMAAVDKLFGIQAGRTSLNERIDMAMSDIDLVPLFIQENYLNYKPVGLSDDSNSVKMLEKISMAADYISCGDLVNVQVRRFQQWQHLPFFSLTSSVIPAYIVHGNRQAFTGEMNFNRFPSWLGKNSSYSKFSRLLEEANHHLSASATFSPTRSTIRLDYALPLVEHIISPLKHMTKEKGVEETIRILEDYSLTLEDLDTLQTIIKFKSGPDPIFTIPTATKSLLTRKFKSFAHQYKSSDLLPEVLGLGKKRPTAKKKFKSGLEVVGDLDLPQAREDLGDSEDGDDAEGSENEANDVHVASTPKSATKSTPVLIFATQKGKKRKTESTIESNKGKKPAVQSKGKPKRKGA